MDPVTRITVVSHALLGNAPPLYMLIEVEFGGLVRVQAERNPVTKGEWRWPSGVSPTEQLTRIADLLYSSFSMASCGRGVFSSG
jgi:hypothetical protein